MTINRPDDNEIREMIKDLNLKMCDQNYRDVMHECAIARNALEWVLGDRENLHLNGQSKDHDKETG